jgi:hypothetical protein
MVNRYLTIDQKNESIFNICVNQIVKLFSLNPRFGGLIMAKIVQFMMSKEMFKRQLAAALFEELAEPVHEQITRVLEDASGQDHLTSIFVVEPFAEILGEKTTDFDKIVETSMKDMDLEKMLMHIRNPQNYLYSKNEKLYNQNKKNKTNAIDETYVMSRIGGTETFDVRTIGESDNPEEYLISCIEKSKGKKPKGKAAKKASNKDKDDEDDDEEKEEISDEITKKLKLQEDGTIDASEGTRVRISTILIRILDVARLLLFNLNWEIRHGASLIIRAAARKANLFYYFNHYDTVSSFNSKEFILSLKAQIEKEKESGIRGILEDSVVRSLLILALDRFSDFIGDKSNIIVRDISSQAVADSLNFLKSQELTVKMIKYFKELLGRDIKQGWEPKHGAVYLMCKLIAKNPKPTPAFFKEFCDLICSKIAEHEEILEVGASFFQQVITNDESLINNKTLTTLCKSFLDATQKLDDISYSVSPASRLIGDLFNTMQRRGTKEEVIGSETIKTIMVKFFFHHTVQVRTDLFYLLSNWLVYQGKRATADSFSGMRLLMKMYLIGIYTETDPKRRDEMVNHFYICTESFDDISNVGFLSLIAEFSSHWTIKEFLNIVGDKDIEEMVQNNRNWTQTSEETISSTRVFLTLGVIVWKLFEKLSSPKKSEVIKIFTGYQRNILCDIFVLSLMQRCSSSFKEKELKGLQLPNPQEMLELTSQQVATPHVDALMHTFLGHLDSQVRDYLGGLEFPELKVHLFKLLQLLQNFREQKFAGILASIESIRNDVE